MEPAICFTFRYSAIAETPSPSALPSQTENFSIDDLFTRIFWIFKLGQLAKGTHHFDRQISKETSHFLYPKKIVKSQTEQWLFFLKQNKIVRLQRNDLKQ